MIKENLTKVINELFDECGHERLDDVQMGRLQEDIMTDMNKLPELASVVTESAYEYTKRIPEVFSFDMAEFNTHREETIDHMALFVLFTADTAIWDIQEHHMVKYLGKKYKSEKGRYVIYDKKLGLGMLKGEFYDLLKTHFITDMIPNKTNEQEKRNE